MLFDLWITNEKWYTSELVESPTCKTDVFFFEHEFKGAIDDAHKKANEKAQGIATSNPELVESIECVKDDSSWTIFANLKQTIGTGSIYSKSSIRKCRLYDINFVHLQKHHVVGVSERDKAIENLKKIVSEYETKLSYIVACRDVVHKSGEINVLLNGVLSHESIDKFVAQMRQRVSDACFLIDYWKLDERGCLPPEEQLLIEIFGDKEGMPSSDGATVQSRDNNNDMEYEIEKMVTQYRNAANEGDAFSQYRLGRCYAHGDGVKQDITEAVKWYRKASEQGYANAQYELGCCYNNGDGVGIDYEEAAKWYRKAAEQGYVLAQHRLGMCYAFGEGVEEDKNAAVKWCRKAAEQGYARAQYILGRWYDKGRGVDEDKTEAAKWYHMAAEQGDVFAQYNLGCFYFDGKGVAQNFEEAVKWYRLAAERGYASAQNRLGCCYDNGRGVKRDFENAVRWFRMAAKQGNDEAQKKLQEKGLSW